MVEFGEKVKKGQRGEGNDPADAGESSLCDKAGSIPMGMWQQISRFVDSEKNSLIFGGISG